MGHGSVQDFELFLRADDLERVRLALSALSPQPAEDGFVLSVGRAEPGPLATLVTVRFDAHRDEVRSFFSDLATVVRVHQVRVDGFDGQPTAEALAERYDAWHLEVSKPGARLTGARVRVRERLAFWMVCLFLVLGIALGACAYLVPVVGEALSGIHF
jgi:hypothetical protein